MCPNEKKNSKNFHLTYVSKVITGFEYFQSRFTQQAVLSLESIVLDPEFSALSDGATFRGGHQPKATAFLKILTF